MGDLPPFPHIFKYGRIILRAQHRLIQADVLAFVFVDPHIDQVRIFVALELLSRFVRVHQGTVKKAKTDKQFQVLKSLDVHVKFMD